MKLHLFLLPVAAALIAGGSIAAQQLDFMPDADVTPNQEAVKYTLLKPDDKTSEILKPTDRNPFGKSDDVLKAQNGKGTNEENTIRDRLTKLRVVGVSPGKNGLRVMLGDMILEAGQTLPPVMVDQSVDLRVNAITPQSIDLVWVEKKATGLPPRGLTIPVDLRPYVRYMLHGQASEKNKWEKEEVEEGEQSIGRQFPDVTHTTLPQGQPGQKSSNPVATLSEATAPLSAAESEDAPAPAAGSSVKAKPSTWEKAMGFLNQLVKTEDSRK